MYGGTIAMSEKTSLKQIQQFFLMHRIRVKMRIHPTEPRIFFRLSPRTWWRLRSGRMLKDADPPALAFWSLKPPSWQFVLFPLLMPWECREQIAVYTYLD